jgi:hypothetical protein
MQIDATGGMAAKSPQEGESFSLQPPPDYLTEARLTDLQAKLRRIDNPIGLMLVEHLMAYDYSPHLLEHLQKMKKMRDLMKLRLAAEVKIQDEG